MRIVHLYKDYFPPTFGGIEQTVHRLAVHFAARGDEVTVLTSHPGVRRTVEETLQGVRVIRCAEWGRALSTPLCLDMPRRVRDLEADVWHLHYPSPPGEVSWWMARPPGALVITWHGDIVRQRPLLPIYGPLVRALLRRADGVMRTYERQADVSPLLRPFKHKTTLVPLGIDLEPFTRAGERGAAAAALRATLGTPLVVCVGRLVPYKGVHVLIEAAPRIEGNVVIVGTGPERPRLEARVRALGLERRVTFTGRVEADRLLDLLAAADVGVLPSSGGQESFGLSMVEMMACGLPVVCTELGTGTSFVNAHGETGLVVPAGDPAALARAVGTLLHDAPLRRRLGDAARARAQRLFSTDAMVRGVAAVYAQAVDRRGIDLGVRPHAASGRSA